MGKHEKKKGLFTAKVIRHNQSKTSRIINKKKNKVILLIRAFFMVLLVVSFVYFVKWNNENIKNKELIESLDNYFVVDPDDSQKFSIDFENLGNLNNNIYAWLTVNGTAINYPVVHYTDNDYYLSHTFDNSRNSAGCPFVDYRAKCDGTDKNLVIYAHNRKDRKYVFLFEKCFKKRLVFK